MRGNTVQFRIASAENWARHNEKTFFAHRSVLWIGRRSHQSLALAQSPAPSTTSAAPPHSAIRDTGSRGEQLDDESERPDDESWGHERHGSRTGRLHGSGGPALPRKRTCNPDISRLLCITASRDGECVNAPASNSPTAAPPAVAAGPAMTLDEAVGLALSKNERARIAELNDDVSKAAVEKARTAFLPILQLTGNDQQRPEDTTKNGVVTQPANIGTAAIQFSQPVVNVPAWPLYSAAKANYEGTQAQSVDDKRVLSFDTAKAFLTVLNTEELFLAAQRRVDSAKADLDDTRARAEAQLSSSNDVTRAQIALASAAREASRATRECGKRRSCALEFLINAKATGAL